MRLLGRSSRVLLSAAVLSVVAVYADLRSSEQRPAHAATGSAVDVPLKDAKLNIEHNATDEDTGFQGFVDSDGWPRLDVRGPAGDGVGVRGPRHARRPGADRVVLRVGRARERRRADRRDARDAARGRLHDRRAGEGERRAARAHVRQGPAHPRHPGGPEADLPRGGRDRAAAGAVARWGRCPRRSPAIRSGSSPTS